MKAIKNSSRLFRLAATLPVAVVPVLLSTACPPPCQLVDNNDGTATLKCGDVASGDVNLNFVEPLGDVQGSFTIQNSVDLEQAKTITSLTGSLIISAPGLESLAGLENIKTIGDDLIISSNTVTSLAGLDAVESIGGDLIISDNDALADISALVTVTTIGGDLLINNNDALGSLAGLETGTPGLANDILISDNEVLDDLSGITATDLQGDLTILDNPSLKDVNLGALVTINGDVILVGNEALTTTEGLVALEEVGSILIVGSDDLETFKFDALTLIGGSLNLSNFANLTDVVAPNLQTIGLADEDNLGSLVLSNLESFETLELNALEEVGLDVIISGTALSDLTGLEGLASVGGSLIIDGNADLKELGLGEADVAGDATITNNPKLPAGDVDDYFDGANVDGVTTNAGNDEG